MQTFYRYLLSVFYFISRIVNFEFSISPLFSEKNICNLKLLFQLIDLSYLEFQLLYRAISYVFVTSYLNVSAYKEYGCIFERYVMKVSVFCINFYDP